MVLSHHCEPAQPPIPHAPARRDDTWEPVEPDRAQEGRQRSSMPARSGRRAGSRIGSEAQSPPAAAAAAFSAACASFCAGQSYSGCVHLPPYSAGMSSCDEWSGTAMVGETLVGESLSDRSQATNARWPKQQYGQRLRQQKLDASTIQALQDQAAPLVDDQRQATHLRLKPQQQNRTSSRPPETTAVPAFGV
jgi:hypothetical protein